MVRWSRLATRSRRETPLAEVQTDKAVMPMESFDEGVIAHLDVKEGEDIRSASEFS